MCGIVGIVERDLDRPIAAATFHVPAALIIGRRRETTDRKTSLNDALREFGVPV